MSPIDEVRPLLKRLKMSGILDSLQLRVEQAVEDKSSYPEFLLRIMHDEVERRDAKMLMTRLRRANFEHQRTLEDFDFSFNPQIDKHRVIDLATCAFIVTVQAWKERDDFDRLGIWDRQEDRNVIYLRGWSWMAASPG